VIQQVIELLIPNLTCLQQVHCASSYSADLSALIWCLVLAAATESGAFMEQEVVRLEQLNKDMKAACQELQAAVEGLTRYDTLSDNPRIICTHPTFCIWA